MIRGLVKIKSPLKNWDQPIGDQETLEVEFPLGIAKALAVREAPIGDISRTRTYGDKFVISVKGPRGISMLQGRLSLFLREKFPGFKVPFGGDTEVLFRPNKPKYGFRA